MLKIGLTGGIGTGKSSASSLLKEKGIPVVDADAVAREVLHLYPEILDFISLKFGAEFIDTEGNLKRKKFGDFIFSDAKKREEYEKIIIPFIIKEIFSLINKFDKQGFDICVLDAPTLIENDIHILMDKNILVWVDKETQIKRVMARDNLSRLQAQKRIDAQLPLEDKKRLVDYVIDNSALIVDMEKQLEHVILEIRRGCIK